MMPYMNVARMLALGLLASLGLLGLAAGDAMALDYPTRPVRWVVAYPPGGTTDILARLVGQYLSNKLGQQFIIDNRPGGGNNIGTEAVVHAPPDGYTVLFVNPVNGINTSLYKKLSFNFPHDIAPVGGITRVPNVMEVNVNVPAKTVAEFIAYAKGNPGKVNMASSGNGTSVHLSGELFMAMTGVKMTHVPYRGAAPAITDMIAGQVHVLFDNLPSSIEQIKGDKLRALAQMGVARIDVAPGVDDADHRPAGPVGRVVADLAQARAVTERAQIADSEPAMAAQLFRTFTL